MLDWGFSILRRLLTYGGMRDNLNLPHLILVLCLISEAGDSDAAAAAAAASPPAA